MYVYVYTCAHGVIEHGLQDDVFSFYRMRSVTTERLLLEGNGAMLGPELILSHADTLTTVGNLACSLGDQGKHAEAE